MKLGCPGVAAALLIGGLVGMVPAVRAVESSQPPRGGISDEASETIHRMGATLSANNFSFQARTIRVYLDNQGQPLHIFHTVKIAAHRPNRLAVHAVGDDGSNDLYYDGKTVSVTEAGGKKYVKIAGPGDIQTMMSDVSTRLNIDFPLADLLDPAPGKAVLSGVTAGRKVETSTIDGKPCDHLFFSQTGGIELELWVDKTDKALPRRLIVTYRLLAGQPSFIAEFSNWDFSSQPDSEFSFRPAASAQQIQLSDAKVMHPAKRSSKL
jgi:hypothetical protein